MFLALAKLELWEKNRHGAKKRARVVGGKEGVRQYVRITHNPETISPEGKLKALLPKVNEEDIIYPGSLKISFDLKVEGGTPKLPIFRNIISQVRVTCAGDELYNLNSQNIFNNYLDVWRSTYMKTKNKHELGYGDEIIVKKRLGLTAKGITTIQERIAKAHGKRFSIPLDFELFKTVGPFYQYGLKHIVIYELDFASVSDLLERIEQVNTKIQRTK